MGFFDKLFSRGPRKPPGWASDFDGGQFDRFCEVVLALLEKEGYERDREDIRSGSVVLARDREWIFHELAARCAGAPESEWPQLVRRNYDGGDVPDELEAKSEAKQAWATGTMEQGCVVLECGPSQVVMVLLPTRERVTAWPKFPSGMVTALIACNAPGDEAAKVAGTDRIHQLETMPDPLVIGPLTLSPRSGCVLAKWDNGVTALVGDAIPLSLAAKEKAQILLGMLVFDEFDPLPLLQTKIVLMANVPGPDPEKLAKALSTMGFASQIAHMPVSKRQQVIAHLLNGDLDGADQIAAQDESLRFERAMIALMKNDEEAALAHLAQVDTPQAKNSRALLYARKRDPRALDEAKSSLAALPNDAIAIRGAVIVHAQLGDREGARAILRQHPLDAESTARLEQGIDQPPELTAHRFPELAETAVEVAKGMLDGGRFAEAEPILRRANQWDPDNLGLAAELGFALSQLGRDADAIAIYDAQIARGGSNVLLRYNRGNCRLRLQKFGDAGEDFRACLEVKPDWHEARINLVSALYASGDKGAANSEIGELRKRGGPAQHIQTLEKMIAGTL
jgi:tetratricopeptide (TPR) repeat protein